MNKAERVGRAIDEAIEDIVKNGYGWNDSQVADHLEHICKLAAQQPRASKPLTGLNRSALKRLEQLRNKS